jgi:hypothetical protein
MDLNNVDLSPKQINDLYKDSIVTIDSEFNASKQSPSELHLKGKFNQKILWIVDEADYPFLSDEDFQFLTQILNACKRNLDDIALLNINKEPLDPSQLQEQIKPVIVIASGLTPERKLFQVPDYTISKQDAYQFLSTDSLSQIRNNQSIKQQLWKGLKQLFEI